MLPINSGGHPAYQNFLLENLRKYYPDPDSIARSTWDIIDRFWNLDLSFTDEFMKSKYSTSNVTVNLKEEIHRLKQGRYFNTSNVTVNRTGRP